MAKYKINSTYLQFSIILETEANDKAFEMFVAYCDYHGIDEDDIECEIESSYINKMLEDELAKLDQF